MKQQNPLIQQGWLRALVFLVVWLILQIALNAVMYMTILPHFMGPDGKNINSYGFLISSFLSLLANLGITWLFRRNIDRQNFISLGFWFKGAERHAWTGMLVAILVLSLGTFLLILTGNLRFIGIDFHAKSLSLYLLLMVIIAISEEVIVRGYLLNNLLDSFPKWLALIISAIVFSLLHLLNPSVNLFSILGIFSGGLVLGVNYVYTRNLWYGIFFHFAWNFLQGPVLGYQVSGIEMESMLVPSIHGASWWTGGPFGFEASLMAIIFNLAAAAFLFIFYNRKQTPVLQTA